MILPSSAPRTLHPDLIVPEPTPSPHIVFQVFALKLKQSIILYLGSKGKKCNVHSMYDISIHQGDTNY